MAWNSVKKWLLDYLLYPCVGMGICLILWSSFSAWSFDPKADTNIIDPATGKTVLGKNLVPSPTETIVKSWKYVSHAFIENESEGYRGIGLEIWDSLKLVGMGYFAALLVAVPIGFVLGSSELFRKCFDPIFQILRPVSPLAWFPLSALIVMLIKKRFGMSIEVTQWQCIFTIAICSVWPTILNTAVGVRAIPQDYLNVSRVLRLSVIQRFFKIYLPATMPYMFTGFRLSMGISWLVIVAVEMLAGKNGIGFFLFNQYNGGNYEAMIFSIIVIGVVGYILDRIMNLAEKKADFILLGFHGFTNYVASFLQSFGKASAEPTAPAHRGPEI
jgi:nitrate/nitrite transport system permease protein